VVYEADQHLSLTEIAGGMRSPERREVMSLLGSMQRFEVSEQVAWRAATLMREYRRSLPGSASRLA